MIVIQMATNFRRPFNHYFVKNSLEDLQNLTDPEALEAPVMSLHEVEEIRDHRRELCNGGRQGCFR